MIVTCAKVKQECLKDSLASADDEDNDCGFSDDMLIEMENLKHKSARPRNTAEK